ncbi:MAG: class I SAM-dependent methyltransferase [Actinomycetota bacterium]|nr:class I SAM-dependent methyltransferase [Actinomycetota bacterium]
MINDNHYESERNKLARSFAKIANDYAQSRPTYSDLGLLNDVLIGRDVLELGAGTGLFSRLISSRKTKSFFATDLSFEMLLANRAAHSSNKIAAVAENLPFQNATFDTVAVAQAAHWFDLLSAPQEIRRIMRNGGTLLIIWNHRDSSKSWVRAFDEAVDSYQNRIVTDEILKGFEATSLFGKFSHRSLPLLHRVEEVQAKQLINSFSPVSTLPDKQRELTIEKALTILRDAHPGSAYFEIPYTTNYFFSKAK